MEKLRGHVVKIYPTPAQEIQLKQGMGCNRYLWNQLIDLVKQNDGENPGLKACEKHLMQLKRQHAWMYDAVAQSLQQTIRDLDRGFKSFEKAQQKPGSDKDAEPPNRYRKRGERESFRLPQSVSVDVARQRIRIPKVGELRTRQSLKFPGELRNVTIKFEDGLWFAVLLMRSETDPKPTRKYLNSCIGGDMGIAHFCALSDGTFLEMPELDALYDEIAGLQRSLKRRTRGSVRWCRTQETIKRVHRRIRDIRRDFHHKSSTILANSHGRIVLEKLNVKSMMKSASGTIENPGKNVKQKQGLNREIGRRGWSSWIFMVRYKVEERGGIFEQVPAHYSSQTCSECGHVSERNRLSQAIFECENCGHAENADINAARVIRGRSLSRKGSVSCRRSQAGARIVRRPSTTEIPVLV